MDEMINEADIEGASLEKHAEILKFLVTQQKLRQAEIEALKEGIKALEELCRNYISGESFEKFKCKYGERLDPYNDTMRLMEGEDFDMTKSAYDTYNEVYPNGEQTQDAFVDEVIANADEYLGAVKEKLGISPDTAISVTDTGNGEVEVKADTDGDGEPDTPVAEGSETSETAETEPASGENTESEISEEDKKSIDEAVDSYSPKR